MNKKRDILIDKRSSLTIEAERDYRKDERECELS